MKNKILKSEQENLNEQSEKQKQNKKSQKKKNRSQWCWALSLETSGQTIQGLRQSEHNLATSKVFEVHESLPIPLNWFCSEGWSYLPAYQSKTVPS